MRKIPGLYQRGPDGAIRDEITPGAEWVIAGEGVATRKWDGTAVMVRDGKLYKRFEAKHGKKPPLDFEPAQDPDPITGHWPGWVPVDQIAAEDRWHREGFALAGELPDGTYELCGPKVQANPEGFASHVLVPHGTATLADIPWPITFEGLRAYLDGGGIEGIVWHHPDGRMVKIKARDFGVERSR